MKLLAIDTAAELCAACVYEGDCARELGRQVLDIGKGHAETLMGVIERALAAAQTGYHDLEGIAVSVGPGSFTGVRIGVATARGLALALKVPAVGVTTLAGIALEARQTFPARSVMSVLDARREELYVAIYGLDGAVLVPPAIMYAEDAARLANEHGFVLSGSGADIVRDAARVSLDIAGRERTADIASYAALAATGGLAAEKPRPLYLRGADARPQEGFALPRRTA